MPNQKVLIITYYWPPSGGSGVQRWMNFALQLKERGWKPIVYTPESTQFDIKDKTLLEKVKNIPVIKTTIWEPFDVFHKLTRQKERKHAKQGLILEKSQKTFMSHVFIWIRGNLFIPDPRVFWVRKSIRFLMDFIKKEKITIIITTGPPHSMHLIGRGLKKHLPVRWIADFRDPWSQWYILQRLKTTTIAKAIHKKLEKRIISSADAVTTISKRLGQSFYNMYHKPITILHNGITPEKLETKPPSHEYFTLGYFGMLNEIGNPSQLWQVLDQLCQANKDFDKQLRLKIGGTIAESIQEEIQAYETLKNKVIFLGYLPYQEVKTMYRTCHLLILTIQNNDNAKFTLPGKFFDYLDANRKMLALGYPEGDMGDLMNDRDIGQLFNYTSTDEMRDFIIGEFKNRTYPNKKDINELIHRFSHKRLTDTLEAILR